MEAKGNYPKGTPVQHVAHYQNDGTEKIKPAKFVEAAEETNGRWQHVIDVAVQNYLDGDDNALLPAAARIAKDIGIAVNRIKTGQLKTSMEPKVE